MNPFLEIANALDKLADDAPRLTHEQARVSIRRLTGAAAMEWHKSGVEVVPGIGPAALPVRPPVASRDAYEEALWFNWQTLRLFLASGIPGGNAGRAGTICDLSAGGTLTPKEVAKREGASVKSVIDKASRGEYGAVATKDASGEWQFDRDLLAGVKVFYVTQPPDRWPDEARDHATACRVLAEIVSPVGRWVSVRKSDIFKAMDLSEKESRTWQKNNAKAIRGKGTAKRIDLNLDALNDGDRERIEKNL